MAVRDFPFLCAVHIVCPRESHAVRCKGVGRVVVYGAVKDFSVQVMVRAFRSIDLCARGESTNNAATYDTGDLEGEGGFTPAVSFDFEGVQCSDVCEIVTSVGAIDGDSSDGSTGRTIAIAVGSVVAGVGFAALIIFGALFLRKRKARDAGAKAVGAGGGDAPADANAPVPVPVFEVGQAYDEVIV